MIPNPYFFRSSQVTSPSGVFDNLFKPHQLTTDPGHNYAIYKEDDKYVAELEVPGFSRSDFSIEWEGDKLHIKGERQRDKLPTREYITNNRSSDNVEFKITDCEGDVDRQKTHASYEAGVLYIVMPMNKDRKQKVEVR